MAGKLRALSLLCGLLLSGQINSLGQHAAAIFYHLTTRNGLSSNRTTAVIQDREGYYWIATEDGLNRFDGTSCKVYRSVRSDPTSLSNNFCFTLIEDNPGNIWIGTHDGISVYRPGTGDFRRIYLKHPFVTGEKSNGVKEIVKDHSGNIYIGAYALWVYNTSTGKWKTYLHNDSDSSSIPEGSVYSLIYDSLNNGLWMKTFSGFAFFEIASGKFFYKSYNPKKIQLLNENCDDTRMVMDATGRIWYYDPIDHYLKAYSMKENRIFTSNYRSSGSVSTLSIDNKDRIWIQYWNTSTAIYSPSTNSTDTSFLQPYHRKSALSPMIYSIFVDRNGNYWICSKKGVSIFNSMAQAVNYYTIDVDSLPYFKRPQVMITAIAEEHENRLWVGTNLGLFHFDLSSKQMKNVRIPFNVDLYVRTLYLDRDSILWIGGQSGMTRYDTRQRMPMQFIPFPSPIQFICAQNTDRILVGTWLNGLYSFSAHGKLLNHLTKGPDSNHALQSNYLLGISTAPKDHLWLGYNGGNGFSKLSADFARFEHFRIPDKNQEKVSNSVNCLAEDKEANLWIGTYGAGVAKFDRTKGQYFFITQQEGLSGNYINALYPDDLGRIWISTCNGLDILDMKTNTLLNTDIDLEQSGNDFISNCLVRKNNKLLFFAQNRIAEISPSAYMETGHSSDLLISSFKIFDKELYLSDEERKRPIRLSHKQNFFSFEFSLLKPDPESFVQYAYLLEGFDPDWNVVRGRHFANYTNVPPGHYNFRVKAMDISGKWSSFSKPLSIFVSPPFWKEWWFIVLMVIFAIVALYSLFRFRLNQVRRMYELRSGISKDLHDQIGATLTSISFLSEVARQQLSGNGQAQNTLVKIGDHSRDMISEMNDIVWAIDPMNDSFERIIDRMENFALPFLSTRNIECTFACEDQLKDLTLNMKQRKNLYLIFKESLNNAAKYAQCNALSIAMTKANGHVQMEIRDNGKGFNTSGNGAGNGLRNMRLRAADLDGQIHIDSVPGSGTIITLWFPITPQNAH